MRTDSDLVCGALCRDGHLIRALKGDTCTRGIRAKIYAKSHTMAEKIGVVGAVEFLCDVNEGGVVG
jgi:hypothetical protein